MLIGGHNLHAAGGSLPTRPSDGGDGNINSPQRSHCCQSSHCEREMLSHCQSMPESTVLYTSVSA
ncbi:hypothetical protein BAUCODRAFT_119790 [Baudoinia panamericana UAMH 10762]|uniref:Uncharacterized protein n=1 Tax=Baudoinia panamericana (strain UAMH 10762) TaxID=717646 RepID=M2LZU7_BAUPA|nr:uncharacterized protein BAUCODRAFT_119790 [Baudoinia panamericana UAMH 10762]EMD00243.1 hypothetical protein BAUCODRAFT_119790 [Baudoinia panamericana UAMH 10762]